MKLLIADDEPVVCGSLAKLIGERYRQLEVMTPCVNGIEALAAIMDENPDIVLTDLRMPGLSGLEVIGKTRQMGLDCEFIILSGYGEFKYAQQAIACGVNAYLLKPYEDDELFETLDKAIKRCVSKEYFSSVLQQHDSGTRFAEGLKAFCDMIRREKPDLSVVEARLSALLGRETITTADAQTVTRFMLLLYSELGLAPSLIDIESIKKLLTAEDSGSLIRLINQNLTAIRERYKMILENEQTLVYRCKEYVNKYYANQALTLKGLAEKQLFMNVDYVSRQFKKETGQRFSVYLTEVRLRRAQDLLRSGCSVGEVAKKVGYGDNVQYFSNVFKKNMGVPPSRFVE